MRRLVLVLAGALALCLAPGSVASHARAAGWCGSGETSTDRPDVVAGDQSHFVYAVPADGTDNFASEANVIADDANEIQSWWAGQDATRTVRFDEAAFTGGCTAPDISFVRLAETGAQIGTNLDGAFSTIEEGVRSLNGRGKIAVVLYDGPQVDPNICGNGSQLLGVAVVWLGSCRGVPTAPTVAHEMLHTLGAVPAGAPHPCGSDTAHVCDSPADVMYPHLAGAPLEQLYLDWGHDDYYAHSGPWLDVQDSPFLHRLDEAQVALAEHVVGGGTVASQEPGPACTSTCSIAWDPGSAVDLAADPQPGDRLVAWSGACTGSSDSCSLRLDRSASVTATFGPETISVKTSVSGAGRIACSPSCAQVAGGSTVVLRAVASRGWRFTRWSGGCKGTAPTCRPATDYPVAVHATFARVPKTR